MNNKLHAYCPTCNMQVELKESGSYRKRRPADDSVVEPYDPTDIPWIAEEYVLCSCPKCESPFLFKREWYEIPAKYETVTSKPELLYPTSSRLPISSLAQSIAKPYQNAVRSYEVGLYEPCVIMCRKCLEALCLEHGIKKGSLKSKLATLQQRGVIDAKLHAWTDGLRVVGNDAAHEFNVDITHQDARDALDFVEAAISYIFLLGKKFNEFQKRRAGVEDQTTQQPLERDK